MKTRHKYLLLIGLFLAGGPLLHAQMGDEGARLGLKLGINGNRFYDDIQAEDLKSKTGIILGGFAKIRLTKHFFFRPELLFATRGGEYSYANLGKTDLKLQYVELPLSLEYSLFSIINLHGGLHLGVLAGQNGKFEDSQGQPVNFDLQRDDTNSLNYGWHLGGGIDLGNLGLHLRFLRGLQKVGKSDSFRQQIGDLKTAAWEFAISYALK